MKTFLGCFFATGALILIASFAGLFYLSRHRPSSLDGDPHVHEEKKREEEELEQKDPDKYEKWVDALRQFQREDAGEDFAMTYGFIDHNGAEHHVTCSVNKKDYQKQFDTFGYDQKQINAQVDTMLQARVDRELSRRGLSPYMTVRFSDGGGYQWEYNFPGTMDRSEVAEKEASAKELVHLIETDYKKRSSQEQDRLYLEHGFLTRKNQLFLDYAGLVKQSQPLMRNCFNALYSERKQYNERQFIGEYLAFFQELQYEVPPLKIGNRTIWGLWVPTEVLVNDHGDCDSKSVAFSAMCKSLGLSVILIEVPNHVLVGVESKPGPGERFVQVNNRYFILCEPAGPGKLRPGHELTHDVSGTFEYTLVEPDD